MNEEIQNRLAEITKEEASILKNGGSLDRTLYMENGQNVINAKKMLEIGKLIAMRKHTRFLHFPKHSHDYIEIIYVYSGAMTHVIGEKSITLSEGETLFLNPHTVHEILPAGENDLAVNFIVLPQFFAKTVEMTREEESPLRKFILDCIAGRESTNGYLYFKTAGTPQIRNLFENLILSFLEKRPDKRNIRELSMELLILELIGHSSDLTGDNISKNVYLEALRYLEENYQTASLLEFADQNHYNVPWLSRYIRQKAGRTFTELLQEKRLSRAEYLLRCSDMRVGDIATSVGYHNTEFFHRLFKERFGVSPKKYRDRARKSVF